jgi:lipopolysaccharide biosynthesis protein
MTKIKSPVRALAFVLPQFHPIPENDTWWGMGFTEWTNVSKAIPYFKGHYQPHLPSDLGFYDLRLPEARMAQSRLASEYGIHGFCYYHYWFNGKRILEQPVEEMLRTAAPNFPFCLCWANENWTRRWDGQESEILLKQEYGETDDKEHIQSLIPSFRDPRYIKVDGKPLFLVYRLSHLPDPQATINLWQKEVRYAGFAGIYLVNVESHPSDHGLAAKYSLDAAVEFAPDWNCVYPLKARGGPLGKLLEVDKALREHRISSYSGLVEKMKRKERPSYLRFPCVTPMWDNSARRKTGATILVDSTPELYGNWLQEVVDKFEPSSPQENFVFINAWNEWAEGNHLEPCHKWGRAYLDATRKALGLVAMPPQ